MWRPNIRNKTFDWMGEQFAPFIDRDHFLGHSSIGLLKWNLPVNDFKEDQLFKIQLLVPGFAKKELKILIDNDKLLVSGEKIRNKGDISEFVQELESAESFRRTYQLLPETGRENITATYREGLLNIVAKRIKQKKEKSRSIKVQ